MKRISLLVYLSFSILALVAQNQYDAIWLFGSPRLLPTDTHFGGSMLDFRSGVPEASYFELDIFLDPTAIICDENGELVFYTNGCKIMNAQHEIMENGDTINAGIRHEQYCDYSYPTIQGLIALPKPESVDQYGLFHALFDADSSAYTAFLYTEVDGAANDGLGKVKTKDQILFEDNISTRLTAVRHANGRDWWIVQGKRGVNAFHLTLLGPEGPEYMGLQELNDDWEFDENRRQAVFSPDGTIYTTINRRYGLRVYNFDRCDGTFSDLTRVSLGADSLLGRGVAISPNNRFVYVGAGFHLYQIDLEAPDIAASKQIVAEYDGYLVNDSPSLMTTFSRLMLAPDGKIYGTAPNSSNVLHVIHAPNEQGLDCDVEQHGLEIPTLHGFAPPNFPHFRLWDIPGSPCDTLGIDTPTDLEDIAMISSEFQIFPNPTSGLATISFEQPNSGMLQLFDISGQLLSKTRLEYATQYELAVSQYAPGLYLVSFQPDDGVLQWEKLIIQR